jgi:hypothetical protein
MALLTELEAVNRMLSTIGEDPLDAIQEDDVDAQVVLSQLRLTSKELQAKGGLAARYVPALSRSLWPGGLYPL